MPEPYEVSSFTVQVAELRRVATTTMPELQNELTQVGALLAETVNPIPAAVGDAAADLGRSFGAVTDVLNSHLLRGGNAVGEMGGALGEVAEVYARADGQS